MTVYIMPPDCNGIGQETFAAIGADVKESSCLRSDAFVLKPEGTVIKHKFSEKRLKRLPANWRQGEPGLPTLCTCSQVVQGLLDVFAVKPVDQVNNITTVAAGKAIPQVLVETDNKGVGIVTTLQGTPANQPASLPFKGVQQSFVIEDCRYGDYFFEGVELQQAGFHRHSFSVFSGGKRCAATLHPFVDRISVPLFIISRQGMTGKRGVAPGLFCL